MCGGVPAYAIPTDPVLDSPTVRELLSAARGTLVHGDDALLDRESSGLLVAAMTMPNVLDRLFEGCVVISPADRADVLLGLLLAYPAKTFPSPAGIVPTAGWAPLLDRAAHLGSRGARPGHHDDRGHDAHGGGLWRSPRACSVVDAQVEAALRIFEEHVDGRPCSTGSTSARPAS